VSSLIEAVAYFSMKTADSGMITLSNGHIAAELFSKEAAFDALQNALENGLIDSAERNIIRQQIESCLLPEKLSKTARQLHRIEDAIEELFQLIEGELGGPIPDSFSSVDEASPDDNAGPPPEKTTIH